MKLLVVLCFIAAVAAKDTITDEDIEKHPLIGYHGKFGVKLAKQIKEREDEIVSNPSKIAGGGLIPIESVPYTVGIVITLDSYEISVCGGALVTQTSVVTAAHCWWDARNIAREFEIVMGTELLFYGGTRVVTSRVVMHVMWYPFDISNNIALATIPPVRFTNTIQPIALPTTLDKFTGARAVATGFGLARASGFLTTRQSLRSIDVSVISNQQCFTSLGSFVNDEVICTSGVGNVGICAGDFGGPLVAESNGTKWLIGIGSFGPEDCGAGLPSAFTRISEFTAWILYNSR